jgi:hypothetical protein
MGLGTCLIGFAVEAMKRDISIKRFIGIPDDEKYMPQLLSDIPMSHICAWREESNLFNGITRYEYHIKNARSEA